MTSIKPQTKIELYGPETSDFGRNNKNCWIIFQMLNNISKAKWHNLTSLDGKAQKL